MNKKKLTELVGYEPSAEMKRMILDNVKTSGRSVEECAADFQLPDIFTPDDSGTFEHNGETFTAETFEKRYPHRKFITIKSR